MSYKINKSIPASSLTYTKGRAGYKIKYIVIHYTGGKGNARENCQYFSGGNRQASAHYFIDGKSEIYQSVNDWDTAWAVGNKTMNRQTLSIEFCSNGEDFSEAMIKQGAWLVQKKMKEYGIPAMNVIRHHDVYDYGNPYEHWASPHKSCPAPYMNDRKWDALRKRLTGDNTDTGEDFSQIVVDGWIGRNSVKAWQKVLGSGYSDGVISRQFYGSRSRHYALASIQYGSGGSYLVRDIQKLIGVNVDGYMGEQTIKAWQKYVGTNADGYFGNGTARATQVWLNSQLAQKKIVL